MCAVEQPNMPWRSPPAFHQSLLRIEPQKWGVWPDEKKETSGQWLSHPPVTGRRGGKPVFSRGHRLQLGHVSCLEPDEQGLEEVTKWELWHQKEEGFGQHNCISLSRTAIAH